MHIQLLPPTLPPQRPLSPETPRVALTPGQRVTATVLSPDLEGRSMIAFAGRELASRSPLPFPPGSRVVLEVMTVDGDVPQMRVVPDEGAMARGPVAVATYGYAAAVLAAAMGGNPSVAAQAVMRWLPMLVARGLLTPEQARQLTGDLGRLPIPARPGGGDVSQGALTPQAVADALAARAAADPAGFEARLAAALRRFGAEQGAAQVDELIAQSSRGRLAALAARVAAHAASASGGDIEVAAARAALEQLQHALLSEQARVAAHYARDGVVSLRVPLEVDGQDVDVHLQVEEHPTSSGDADEPTSPQGRRLRLDVELATLGRVQAHLVATGSEVRVELLTERPAAADSLEEGLSALSVALTEAGFRDVLARVAIDPVRVAAGDPPLELPPEGSIVSVDA